MREALYNRDIDVLRGVAILLVVSYHMSAVSYIPDFIRDFLAQFNGSFGVDLFFLVSGYLVSASLRRALDSSPDDILSVLKIYFSRRWFRTVFPAVTWVVIWGFLSHATPFLGDFNRNIHHAIAAIFQWAHLFLYFQCVKVDECGIFGYYWSLSLEEWFYFLLPILFVFFSGIIRVSIVLLMLVALFLLAGMGWSMWGVFRIEPMLVGVLIFQYREQCLRWVASRDWVRAFSKTALLLIIIPMYLTAHYFGQAYLIIVGCCGVLVVLSLPGKEYLVGGGLSVALANIGRVSFSIYLVHVPLILLVSNIYAVNYSWMSKGGAIYCCLSLLDRCRNFPMTG